MKNNLMKNYSKALQDIYDHVIQMKYTLKDFMKSMCMKEKK